MGDAERGTTSKENTSRGLRPRRSPLILQYAMIWFCMDWLLILPAPVAWRSSHEPGQMAATGAFTFGATAARRAHRLQASNSAAGLSPSPSRATPTVAARIGFRVTNAAMEPLRDTDAISASLTSEEPHVCDLCITASCHDTW
jgi:hypothetical protein